MSRWRIIYPLLPVLGLLLGLTQIAPGANHAGASAATGASPADCAAGQAAPCHEGSAGATLRESSISDTLYLPLISRPVLTPYRLVVPASADTTVVEGMPHTNFGHTNSIRAGYDDRQPPETEEEAILRGLVGFDLSDLPTGSRVTTATLQLYFFESYDYDGQFRTITTYRPTEDWDETDVTWESAPQSGEAYGSQSIQHCACGGWYEFDVTPLVQAWVDGSKPNHGIMIRGPETSGSNSGWRGFISRDYFPDSSYGPKLVIDYLSTRPLDDNAVSTPKPENNETTASPGQEPVRIVPGSVPEGKDLQTARPGL